MEKESTILRLSTFGNNAQTQLQILSSIALTYRASLDTLMKLFPSLPRDYDKLFNLLMEANYSSDFRQQGLKFLVSFDILPDQNEVAKKIFLFHEKWKQINDINDQKERESKRNALISIIHSVKAFNLLMDYKNGRILTDEEFILTIQYHLKYALTYEQLSGIVTKSLSGYCEREKKLIHNYPNLKLRLAQLAEFNKIKGDSEWKYLPEANGSRK